MQAMAMLDRGYTYGGKKLHTGFDCSGLVTFVYKESAGIALKGNAAQMANASKPVEASTKPTLVTWCFSTPSGHRFHMWASTLAVVNLCTPPTSEPV